MDDDAGGTHHDVHAVLRPHDTDVRGQVAAAPALAVIRRPPPELVRVRPSADHRHVSGVPAAPVNGNLAVGLVRGDHVVSATVRAALQEPQPPVRQRTAAEARLEEFGAQVMVVKHELGPLQRLEGHRERPEDVGRVARLDDGEATAQQSAACPGEESLPRRRGERVRILARKAQLAATGRVRPVLVQLDAIDDLVVRVILALGADHGDPVAGPGERLALQPHPPVERHRKVLDDDEDSCHVGVPRTPNKIARPPT